MSYQQTLVESVQTAGRLLLDHFGHVRNIRIKESPSSIVTDADIASDQLIRNQLHSRHPTHNLLTEESGFEYRGSPFTWVVDPLDGTSNFAAGIPWFGVMAALLEHNVPIAAAMFLPVDGSLYLAERGRGANRNQQPLNLNPATDLADVLCAFGIDAGADATQISRQTQTLARVVQHVRNVRATNSLVDFALTLDGRLGAAINFHTKIWDIVAPWLLLHEAGGCLTDLTGAPISFSLGEDACDRHYAVVGGPRPLHAPLLRLLAPPAP
jgi:myo-inositol-1(or 4)-monophosphatase